MNSLRRFFSTNFGSAVGGGLVVLVLGLIVLIRTFLSRQNELTYQAGAGVVAASNPESELQEVNNKLGALKKAIELAKQI